MVKKQSLDINMVIAGLGYYISSENQSMAPLNFGLLIQKRRKLEKCELVDEILQKSINQGYNISYCFSEIDKTSLNANSNESYNFFQEKYGESGFMIEIDFTSSDKYHQSFPDLNEFISLNTDSLEFKINYLTPSAEYITVVSSLFRFLYPTNPIGLYVS